LVDIVLVIPVGGDIVTVYNVPPPLLFHKPTFVDVKNVQNTTFV